jgi:hypothetical protein
LGHYPHDVFGVEEKFCDGELGEKRCVLYGGDDLAHQGGADDRQLLPLSDFEVNILQGLQIPKGLADPLQLDHQDLLAREHRE